VQIRSDRNFTFSADPDTVWQAIARTDQYRTWWPWLRAFDGGALRAGDRWTCEVRPPLPYPVRFVVVLDEVVAPSRVESRIDGDISGSAVLTLARHDAGTRLRLTSSLEPTNTLLRSLGVLARPLARFGHDWVIATGARQFARAAL
jgi:uncharacterized protein YndB with AHSA1/START domain